MQVKKRWSLRTYTSPLPTHLQAGEVHPIAVKILAARGLLADPQIIDPYLTPRLEHLFPPDSIRGIEQALQRLVQAQKKGHRITIYGDYDVDGVTSTTLLVQIFRCLKMNVDYYVPDRI